MRKKVYQKPTMHDVKLQRQSVICSSPGQAGVQDYNWNTPGEE